MLTIASLIFLVTLVFVIWQPKGLNIGWSASGGAIIALSLESLISAMYGMSLRSSGMPPSPLLPLF